MKKVILLILVIFVLAITGIGAYVKMALPNVGSAPDLKIAITQDRIERGAYLANHVTACMDCHSTRN